MKVKGDMGNFALVGAVITFWLTLGRGKSFTEAELMGWLGGTGSYFKASDVSKAIRLFGCQPADPPSERNSRWHFPSGDLVITDADFPDEVPDEDEFLTRKDFERMTRNELLAVCREYKKEDPRFSIPKNVTNEQLVEILSRIAEEDEDQ